MSWRALRGALSHDNPLWVCREWKHNALTKSASIMETASAGLIKCSNEDVQFLVNIQEVRKKWILKMSYLHRLTVMQTKTFTWLRFKSASGDKLSVGGFFSTPSPEVNSVLFPIMKKPAALPLTVAMKTCQSHQIWESLSGVLAGRADWSSGCWVWARPLPTACPGQRREPPLVCAASLGISLIVITASSLGVWEKISIHLTPSGGNSLSLFVLKEETCLCC